GRLGGGGTLEARSRAFARLGFSDRATTRRGRSNSDHSSCPIPESDRSLVVLGPKSATVIEIDLQDSVLEDPIVPNNRRTPAESELARSNRLYGRNGP